MSTSQILREDTTFPARGKIRLALVVATYVTALWGSCYVLSRLFDNPNFRTMARDALDGGCRELAYAHTGPDHNDSGSESGSKVVQTARAFSAVLGKRRTGCDQQKSNRAEHGECRSFGIECHLRVFLRIRLV